MTLFSPNGNLKKDLKKINVFSKIVEKKLSKLSPEEQRLENLTEEELQDFSKVLSIADYILTKHSQKKEIHELLKEFVGMINESIEAMMPLDDGIDEMVYSAEDGISRIKEIQNNVSDNYSIGQIARRQSQESEYGSKNLTKSSIPAYTHEYQPKSKVNSEQVI